MATQKRFIAKNGLDNNSNTITNVADPSGLQDVATKNYVSSNFVGASSSAYPTVQPTLNLDFANSKTVDPRITFVRNSTATYYDGQTTAMAEQNLLLQSNFVASWSPLNSTLTANSVVAPDGTTTAATLIPNTTSNTHTVYQTYSSVISGATYVLSVYLKASGYNYAILQTQFGGINVYYSFNISTGTLGTINGGATPTITSVGNGWYRCSIVLPVTISTTSNPVTFWSMSTDSVAAFVGNGTSGMQIWGAQLEQRSSVTAYTPTTTAAITNYIPQLMTAPAGVPRLDYAPTTGQALGLLIEESRTNLATYSSDFSNAAWNKNRSSVTSNTTIAPDGTLTADTFIEDTSVTNTHYIYQPGVPVTNALVYTKSIYVKAKERSYCAIQFYGTNSAFASGAAYFNLNTGVVTSTDASITNSSISNIGNGWYRISASSTATATASANIAFHLSSGALATSYTGDGYSGIYIWGAQLEAGAFATSYIPTVASTVTRDADAASMTGTNFSSWYNQSQGSLYAESDDVGGNSNGAATLFNIGAAGNNAIAFYGDGSINRARLLVRLNTVYVINTLSSTTTQPIKQAASFKDGAVSCTANGILFVTNVNVNIPHNLDTLYIGYFPGTASYLTGHIRKLTYYPVALSSSNLVALTS